MGELCLNGRTDRLDFNLLLTPIIHAEKRVTKIRCTSIPPSLHTRQDAAPLLLHAFSLHPKCPPLLDTSVAHPPGVWRPPLQDCSGALACKGDCEFDRNYEPINLTFVPHCPGRCGWRDMARLCRTLWAGDNTWCDSAAAVGLLVTTYGAALGQLVTTPGAVLQDAVGRLLTPGAALLRLWAGC